MKLATMTASDQVRSAERTLSLGTWAITGGAILFSVLTVTPLVRSVSPAGWGWTAPVLPLVVDSAVVIVIRLDATVARLGGEAGRWPAILRWLTGVFTLALNVGWSALRHDLVGVGVHAVAPALLIATGEAGLSYRRAITKALDRIDREQADRRVREQQDRAAREQLARTEREQQRAAAERQQREAREHAALTEQQRADREAADRREEREHVARLEQERLDREVAERREAREHATKLEQERLDREAADRREAREHEQRQAERERAERQQREQRQADREAAERREQQQQTDREAADRRAREQRQQAERAAREQAERQNREREQADRERQQQAERERGQAARELRPRPAVNTPVNTPASEKMTEVDARAAILQAGADQSIRQLAQLTGWSIGWVTARRNEAPQQVPGQTALEGIAA